MSHSLTLPRLRVVDVVPVNEDGQLLFVLRDMWRISPTPLAVSPAGYFVLAHFDGQCTLEHLHASFQARFDAQLPDEQVHSLIESLDAALLLDNPRFAAVYAQRCKAYAASAARDNRERYPNAAELEQEIREMLATAGAQPPLPAGELGLLTGVIAPHLDYARGTPCYAPAYAALAAAPPAARYVILGANHFGRSRSVGATTRDFQTPLGLVRTDRALLAALERRLGQPLCEDQFDHQFEHSVELQVHILQVIHGERAFEILPLLCPDVSGPTGLRPADGRGPDLATFCDGLRELLAADTDRRTIIVCGADLSHVGAHFGDAEQAGAAYLDSITQQDKRLLELLTSREEEEFVLRVRQAQNRTRICSVGNLYATLRLLPGRACRLLGYHQARDFETDTHVSCAAAAIL